MLHEIIGTKLEVSDCDTTFDSVYQKEYVPQEYIDEIKRANLLILPYEEFRGEACPLFPETTREFYDFLKENSDERVLCDIAISDSDFNRIELHSAAIDVATIIVDSLVYEIAVGLIVSFLWELIRRYHREPENTSAKVEIIVQETKRKKSKKIKYSGPVSGIKDTLEKAADNLFADESKNDN